MACQVPMINAFHTDYLFPECIKDFKIITRDFRTRGLNYNCLIKFKDDQVRIVYLSGIDLIEFSKALPASAKNHFLVPAECKNLEGNKSAKKVEEIFKYILNS